MPQASPEVNYVGSMVGEEDGFPTGVSDLVVLQVQFRFQAEQEQSPTPTEKAHMVSTATHATDVFCGLSYIIAVPKVVVVGRK